MTPRARGVFAVILALCVALPLLPTALDDDGARDARVTADDAPPADDGGDDVAPDDGPDVDGDDDAPDDDPADDGRDDDPSADDDTPDDDPTITEDPSTTSGSGGGTPPTAPTGEPSRPATVAVDAIGDLVPGRVGMLSVAITSANTAGGVVTLTVRLDDAGWAVVPDSCTRSVATAVCTFALDAGERVALVFELDVGAGAASVVVAVDAVIAGGPDPRPVEVTIPTVPAVSGLSAAFSRTGFLDVTVIGNTLASCAGGATVGPVTCESARAGTASSARTNDAWAMTEVRADARPSGSSSAADLDLGGETVTRAFLVWGASTTSTAPTQARSLRLATPVTTAGATEEIHLAAVADAAELRQGAEADAEQHRESAQWDAATQREEAEAEAERLRAEAAADVAKLREEAAAAAAEIRGAARAERTELLAAAERESVELLADAVGGPRAALAEALERLDSVLRELGRTGSSDDD